MLRISQRLVQTLMVSALVLSAPAALAAVVNITGALPRNPKFSSSVAITVTVTEVTPAQKATIDAAQTPISDQFSFYRDSNNTALPFQNNNQALDVSMVVISDAQAIVEQKNDSNNYTYTYEFTLEAVSESLDVLVGDDGTMNIAVTWKVGDDEIASNKASPAALQQEFYIITAAPEFQTLAAVGSHKSVTVRWVEKDSVKAKDDKDKAIDKRPSGVTVYLINRDQIGTTNLPARTFDPKNTAGDPPAICTYMPAKADESSVCVICPTDTYLDAATITKSAGIKVATINGTTRDSVAFGDLENDQPYVVFMQYQPDGTSTSQCILAVPNENITMSELNGEGKAKVVDFRCFIATAAYGTSLHEDLHLFRTFRDERLLTNPVGRQLVAGYYQLSPPVAQFIAAYPWLRARVRSGLEIVADAIR